ncbi:hypothetical protein jhhlp_000419 [Lomentospora prolificans]|uniref:tRNA(Ile)-lysidine synthetase n=1 Tax=Lomentospora prolificans TaxID=41688 RepID=A0A2N3NKZ9_9PEZI|nr:hypothetical protein jhhlp_000419 [Lomentospora prolificans]
MVMSLGSRVFYHVPKPISVQEFAEAVRAACPPRYPGARHTCHRRIGLATSGGVDSMAMAFLFSALRSQNPNFMVGDNPCGGVDAFIVNHKLRDGSDLEAFSVSRELSRLPHIRPHVLDFNWAVLLGSPDIDPRTLPNLETVARQGRYRSLGLKCVKEGIDNLFLAHHMDDQYETILMRLLMGHSRRGLMGMHASKDIPECYGMWRVHQTGFLDLIKGKNPPLTYNVRKREVSQLRRSLLSEMQPDLEFESGDVLPHLEIRPDPSTPAPEEYFADISSVAEDNHTARRGIPELAQLETEHGGIRVCRPLLEFPKDRLIATCEQNSVPWFEDSTNKDPGLTPRNAVRHMVRNYRLPEALQRPAILQMAGRIKDSIREEEEEVRELFDRTEITHFSTNTGTMVIRLPELMPTGGDDLARKRTLASLLLRKLMVPVDANPDLPGLPTLQGPVSRLFPHLATDAYPVVEAGKAFNCGDVLFSPLPANGAPNSRWLLSRTPYPATMPLPSVQWLRKGLPRSEHSGRLVKHNPERRLNTKHWSLFDGRFWIRVHLRLPGIFTVEPWRPADAETFLGERQDLPLKKRLKALLSEYAPGKARWTLPALYYRGTVNWATMDARPGEGKTMLALPSLGIHYPRLPEIVEYEVRYKKVDEDVLDKCKIPHF